MYVEVIRQFDDRKLKLWRAFLQKAGLEADTDISQTVLVWEDDTLIATGSRDGNLLKCIAVDKSHQGEDITSTVISTLRKEAFEEGYSHLFLYTKPENESMFLSLFFYPIAKTDKVLLMENRKNGIKAFLDGMLAPSACGKIGAIVANCNPYTLGHRYLIQAAAKECDHLFVFVVAEEKSRFSFEQRKKMVELGTADIKNVTVLSTGPYLVSSATFPTYFLKNRESAAEVKCALDIEIFTKYFVPKFFINCRFVGTEPFSPTTEKYNRALKASLPEHNVEVIEIPRLEKAGVGVSASEVRRLLDEKNVKKVEELVPKTTFEFLKENGFI